MSVVSFSNFCSISGNLISVLEVKERLQFSAVLVTFLSLSYSGNLRGYSYVLLGYPMSKETLIPHFDAPFTLSLFLNNCALLKLAIKRQFALSSMTTDPESRTSNVPLSISCSAAYFPSGDEHSAEEKFNPQLPF